MEKNKTIFGGPWTEDKINIFVKYLKAYLTIMSNQRFELIYFDGFAGCGEIESENYNTLIEGVASKVLNIVHKKKFDFYYLIEKDPKIANKLKKLVDEHFSDFKNVYIIEDDCNVKLKDLANYLRKNSFCRALAFIDPYGLEVNWESLSIFKELGVDMWILIPTGGVNRMLTKNGYIKESWMNKLSLFLGLDENEIKKAFYVDEEINTLFGEEKITIKKNEAVSKVLELYKKQLDTVWDYVSKAYPLKNSKGSVLYHFLLASNNKTGIKIANDIIGKELTK
jgi:three-Cys-motif partner protein